MVKSPVIMERNDRKRQFPFHFPEIASLKKHKPLYIRPSSFEESESSSGRTHDSNGKQDLFGVPDSMSESSHGGSVSSSKSGNFSASSKITIPFSEKIVKLEEGTKEHSFLKQRFLMGMADLAKETAVTAVHKNSHFGILEKAKLQAFQIYSVATMKKTCGNANIKFAWYGASYEKIMSIVDHGFSLSDSADYCGMYGRGIYLSPEGSSINSAMSSNTDENGVRHILLCRVLMGNMEEVPPGSDQFHPSSEEYDSGVDNKTSPKKYIVWPTNMNTHILPEYVVSFRVHLPHTKEMQNKEESAIKPTSDWMPFPALINLLSKFLPSTAVKMINQSHKDYLEKTVTREKLIKQVRQIAGDQLLIAAIKSFRSKQLRDMNPCLNKRNTPRCSSGSRS